MAFAFFAALTVLAALTGIQFGPGEWYAALEKPRGTPPNWLFGPVWSLLYTAIAVTGWMLWRAPRGWRRRATLVLWGVQLLLNAAWSWLFFGRHELGAALVDILALECAIAALAAIAWHVDRRAAWLLVPYWIWVAYATYLNFMIRELNPG